MVIVVRARFWLVIAALLFVAACSDKSDPDPGTAGSSSGGIDSGIADARAADATSGNDAAAADAAPVDTAYLACMDSAGHVNRSLKACGQNSDCSIEHQKSSCCGDIVYVGVNKSSQTALAACQAAWDAHFPACGCSSNQTMTEDGSINLDAEAPNVRCEVGLCRTFTWKN